MGLKQTPKKYLVQTGLFSALFALSQVGVSLADETSLASAKRLVRADSLKLDFSSLSQEEQASPSDTITSSRKLVTTLQNEQIGNAGNKASEKADSQSGLKSSRDSLAPVQNRQLTNRVQATSISSDQVGTGLLPSPAQPRQLSSTSAGQSTAIYTHVHWRPSCIQHFPLYFEDAMLERHGHKRSFYGYDVAQSVISGVKFFATIPLLPYNMTLRPRRECVYALGHYRAGSGAPCLRDNLPYDYRAAIVESASAAAFFWASPL